MNNLQTRFISLLAIVSSTVLLCACLPGEKDVEERYNGINADAAVRNAGVSLSSAANNYLAYVKAVNLKSKVVLGKVPLSFIGTVMSSDNPEPVTPAGITVAQCGDDEPTDGSPGAYGAIAYYHSDPKGIPPLAQSGERMAASLAERYGPALVGYQSASGTQLPAKAKELGCAPGSDIKVGSPIFAVGFLYIDGMLPDNGKTLEGTVDRFITIPCPSPMTGIVKRAQQCVLKTSDDPTQVEREKATVKVGKNVENDVQRLDKLWTCKPDLLAGVPSPTASELALYCRDPSTNLTPQPDQTTVEQAVNLKSALDGMGPGYYSFVCRKGTNGTCDATAVPYTPPPDVVMRCDKTKPPPRFTTNPSLPLVLNGAGEVQTDAGKANSQDCGRGWTGDLIARYNVRRCDLFKKTGGSETLIGMKQTIYHITYAAAQCHRDVSYNANCPVGSGTLPITRRLVMTRPVALDWAEVVPGTVIWSPSDVATNETRASRPDIVTEAQANGYVIPNTSAANLASSATNEEWSLKLARAMNSASSGSVTMDVTACNDSGAPCGSNSANPISIYYDSSTTHPIARMGGLTERYDKRVCLGQGSCNFLLGIDQDTCSDVCQADGFITVGASEPARGLESKIDNYAQALQTGLPQGQSVRAAPSGNTYGAMFDDPDFICSLAVSDKVIAIGSLLGTNSSGSYRCGNTNKSYSTLEEMLTDVIDFAGSHGRSIKVFISSPVLPGQPAGTEPVSDAMLGPTGSVTTAIAQWLQEPLAPLAPCAALPATD